MGLNENDIDWHKDAPTLAAKGNTCPFTVPSGYFENLSSTLKRKVLIESIHIHDRTGFQVPDHYFTNLTLSIENRVSVEKIRALVPTEGFALPEGYFNNLSKKIIFKAEKSSKSKTKVRKLFTSWVSYAAAACITALIATGIYFNSNTYNFNEKLSTVPEQEIMNYLQAYSTAGDTPFIIETLNPEGLEHVNSDVSVEELELYIKSTTL